MADLTLEERENIQTLLTEKHDAQVEHIRAEGHNYSKFAMGGEVQDLIQLEMVMAFNAAAIKDAQTKAKPILPKPPQSPILPRYRGH